MKIHNTKHLVDLHSPPKNQKEYDLTKGEVPLDGIWINSTVNTKYGNGQVMSVKRTDSDPYLLVRLDDNGRVMMIDSKSGNQINNQSNQDSN